MIDLTGVTESESTVQSGFDTIESGAYVCTITSAVVTKTKGGRTPDGRVREQKPCIILLWDIAEGPHKDFFADKFFIGKDFRHNDYIMLDKPTGIGLHKVRQLDRSIPGLRMEQAYSVLLDPSEEDTRRIAAGKYVSTLAGKQFGLLLQERKYTYKGRDQSEVNIVNYLTPEQVRQGDFKVPETLDERKHDEAPATSGTDAGAADVYDEDIPF